MSASEKFRILAVDDDKDILELIQIALGDEYEVLSVQDATSALDVLDLCEPDAVVVDIMMPKVTGYTIVEHMKKQSKHQNTVIVFLTAKDSPRDIKYGYKVGANLYLTKPFQPERLSRSLGVLLTETHGKPRAKTLSLRDIQLRMQLKMGLTPSPFAKSRETGRASGETPPPHEHASGMSHTHRPHAEEDDNENAEKEKRWVD